MDKEFTTIELSPIGLSLAADPSIAVSTSDRTVTFTASDETPVNRFDCFNWEVYQLFLSHDPKHVNLSRVKSRVCMFLEDHRSSAEYELGQIKKAKLESRKLTLTAKLHPTTKADLYLAKVENDTAPGNSVGIQVYELETVKKAVYEKDPTTGRETLKSPALMKATDWELIECSSVSIPANGNASSYNSDSDNIFANTPKNTVRVIGDPGYKKLAIETISHRVVTGEEMKKDTPPVHKKTIKKSKDGKMNFSEMSTDELIDYATKADQQLAALKDGEAKLSAQLDALAKEKSTALAQLTEARQKLTKIETDSKILGSYRDLFTQASKLNLDAKLSKAELDQLFPGETEFLSLENPQMELGQIKYYLMACFSRTVQLSTSLTARTSIIQHPDIETDKDDDADEYLSKLEEKKFTRSY